uniref:Elongation of very long chain fatty acids protein n=1 Tax=Ciona savignyi TaxID=51511 RepID=H2Z288_CIOSA
LNLSLTGFTGNWGFQPWEFEKAFDGIETRNLTTSWNVPLCLSVMYIGMIVGGKRHMDAKKSYNLRKPMLLWSTLLAIFSIVGSLRTLTCVYYLYKDAGIRGLVCDSGIYTRPITRFWTILFVYSKFIEYGDTAFIIFRKQNVICLHWYHHLTVSLFCCIFKYCNFVGAAVFMSLNFLIHAFMYTYYAVRAAGVRLPRLISVFITASQIVQMVLGCATMFSLIAWRSQTCVSSDQYLWSGTIMYGSYLVLFVHFFYNAYLKKKPNLQETP